MRFLALSFDPMIRVELYFFVMASHDCPQMLELKLSFSILPKGAVQELLGALAA